MEPICLIRIMCDISIVSNHDDSITGLSMESRYQFHDTICIALVKISCWFIGEKILYISDKCTCYSDSLCLSSWKLCRVAISLSHQSYLFDYFMGRISSLRMWDIEDKINIFRHCQIWYEFKRLEYKCDMSSTILYHLVYRKGSNICISEFYNSTIRLDDPCDERKKRWLPCSTCTHECNEAPCFDFPVETRKKGNFFMLGSIGFWYIFESDHRRYWESFYEERIRILRKKTSGENTTSTSPHRASEHECMSTKPKK